MSTPDTETQGQTQEDGGESSRASAAAREANEATRTDDEDPTSGEDGDQAQAQRPTYAERQEQQRAERRQRANDEDTALEFTAKYAEVTLWASGWVSRIEQVIRRVERGDAEGAQISMARAGRYLSNLRAALDRAAAITP